MEIPLGMLNCYHVMSGHFQEKSYQSLHSPPIFRFQRYRFELTIIYSLIPNILKYSTERLAFQHPELYTDFQPETLLLKSWRLETDKSYKRSRCFHSVTEISTEYYLLIKQNSKCCIFSFGYFPGVKLLLADVSEPCISSIFKGWVYRVPKRRPNTI